jgi:hypothetical protein
MPAAPQRLQPSRQTKRSAIAGTLSPWKSCGSCLDMPGGHSVTTPPLLAIGSWPPLVSHLSALLLGCTLAYFSGASARKDTNTRVLLPRDSITVTLGHDWLIPGTSLQSGEGRPLRSIALLSTSKGNRTCRVYEGSVTLLLRQPHLSFSAPLSDLTNFTNAMRSLESGKLNIASAQSNLPPCDQEPKVNYGTFP